ncbi:hypothetical protein [Ilumatobacter sp.]|uniref:hypothetical protein n=1 Tax=Ilumatobacter sp. TaxID=1967498 RepID=UPI003B52DC2F
MTSERPDRPDVGPAVDGAAHDTADEPPGRGRAAGRRAGHERSRVGARRHAADGSERTVSWWLRVVVPVVVALVPVVVAGVRAALGPWVPIGDAAYFTARSLDVGTEDHPLLGAWSSGSLDVGRSVNNLGPMQLDLLAPFTRIAPMGGTAIGTVAVHAAVIVTIAWLIRRLAGVAHVLPAMAAVSLLTWQLGSLLLITPTQHQYLLIAWVGLLVAIWATITGIRWALVPVVVLGSLLTQTHLSYPIPVAALAVPVAVVGVIALRRCSGATASAGSSTDASSWRLPIVVASAVAIVLWAQTIVDQVAGSGNLGGVLSSGGGPESPGFVTGLRLVAGVVVSPRGYLRPGYADYVPADALGGDARVALLVVVIAGAVASAVLAWWRGHVRAATGSLVAATALVAAVVDAASLPLSSSFGLFDGNYRVLWGTAAFGVLGAACAAVALATRAGGRAARHVVDATLAAGLVALAVANVPATSQVRDADVHDELTGSVAAVVDALRDVELSGPVLVDDSNMYFGHPYTYPTLVVLLERGVEFRFESEIQFRRFGDGRRSDGTERQRLTIWANDEAVARRADPGTVVFVDGQPPVAYTLDDIDPTP